MKWISSIFLVLLILFIFNWRTSYIHIHIHIVLSLSSDQASEWEKRIRKIYVAEMNSVAYGWVFYIHMSMFVMQIVDTFDYYLFWKWLVNIIQSHEYWCLWANQNHKVLKRFILTINCITENIYGFGHQMSLIIIKNNMQSYMETRYMVKYQMLWKCYQSEIL